MDQTDVGALYGRRHDDAAPRQTAADRLLLLARSTTYNGPQNEAETKLIRSWVLHGNQTIPEQHRG